MSMKQIICSLGKIVKSFFHRGKYTKYDHIIVLGHNCETSYQYKLHYNYNEAHLFSWSFVDDTNKLIHALTNLDELGMNFEPSKPMWMDSKFRIRFHGRGSHDIWEDGASPQVLEKDKQELISRVAHLKSKLREVAKEPGKNAFVYKVPLTELRNSENIAQKIIRLKDAIAALGGTPFNLIIVVTEENVNAILQALQKYDAHGIFVYGVKFYSPNTSVVKGPYDREGWSKIWNLHRPVNIKVDYNKKYKFEQK